MFVSFKKYIINVFLFRSCSDNSWCGLHCRWLRRETQGGFLVIFTFNKNSVEDMWDWVSTPLCSRLLGRVHVTVYWSDKQVPSYGKYKAVYWRIPEYSCNGLLNKCPTKGSINVSLLVRWTTMTTLTTMTSLTTTLTRITTLTTTLTTMQMLWHSVSGTELWISPSFEVWHVDRSSCQVAKRRMDDVILVLWWQSSGWRR